MHHIIGGALLAAIFGTAVSPAKFRPIARGAVKAGLRARDKIEQIRASVKAQSQSLVDEAKSELERERHSGNVG